MLQRKQEMKRRISYFEDSGSSTKKYPLLKAVYNDNNDLAEKIIATDPDQVKQQDPFGGLTALHIAIFRQNEYLVGLLARHPLCDFQVKDNFNRRASDMLEYTSNQRIFEIVIDGSYPDLIQSLEVEGYEQGKADEVVVPFKPK